MTAPNDALAVAAAAPIAGVRCLTQQRVATLLVRTTNGLLEVAS